MHRAYRKHGYWHRLGGLVLSGLNTELIIHSMPKPLLAAQVFFCRLDRYMPKQKLNLLQFTSRIMAEAGARPPEIVWRKF
jgi:hypothetical protein